MKSKILFDQPARDKILEGVRLAAKAVGGSLGPRGNNVAITKTNQANQIYDRTILHDGVSIFKAIDVKDEYVNMGVQVLKEAAQKQVDSVGDGTTAVVVLAEAILNECYKIIATGVNPMSLRKGLEEGRDKLLEELQKHATPINSLKDEERIATISAESEELGKLVAEVLHKVGVEGVITVEESKSSETTYEIQTGLQFDPGYADKFFITDPEKEIAVFEDTYLLLTDKPLNDLSEFEKLFTEISTRGARLVIIAGGYEAMALPILAQNKFRGVLQTLPIRAPSFGMNQKDILQDIAVLTGGKFFNESMQFKWSDITLKELGFARAVVSTKNDTIITGGKGLKKEIDQRISGIKGQIEDEDQDFEIEKLRERLGKLTNGVAAIRVGGTTEIEMKERKERAIDAVHATRAAMQKGIVPGGETIYLTIRNVVYDNPILYKALEKPFRKLVENAGEDPGQTLAMLNPDPVYNPPNQGFDVLDGEYKNMIDAGIIDPLLVPEEAIKNAISVSIQLMTVQSIIVPDEEEK